MYISIDIIVVLLEWEWVYNIIVYKQPTHKGIPIEYAYKYKEICLKCKFGAHVGISTCMAYIRHT